MCTVCGCGQGETQIEGHAHPHTHEHTHADGSVHSHPHDTQFHVHHGDLHYGLGPAHAHAPGLTQARMARIEQDILGKNNAYAAENRRWFADHGLFAVNLVSSPGSG